MKTLKKLLSLLLSVLLVSSLMAPAWAANTTITISDANGGSYKAYQLMSVEASADNGNYAYQLIDSMADAVTAGVKAVNPAFEAKTLTSLTTAAQRQEYATALIIAVEAIGADDKDESGLTIRSREEKTRIFADTVYNNLPSGAPFTTITTNSQQSIPQGYYLLAPANPGADALVILDTAGNKNLNVEAKNDIPSVTKMVKEINDSNNVNNEDWRTAADYDIGDSIRFCLVALMPEQVSNYSKYTVNFIDTLSNGLAYDDASADIKIYIMNKMSDVRGTEVTSRFTPVYDKSTRTLTLSCPDLKPYVNDLNGKMVVAFYSAKLTGDAVIGPEGNLNKVKLEYSSSPYDTSATETTTEDGVKVFTYQLTVKKTDKNGNNLTGAGFTLYKKIDNTWETVKVIDKSNNTNIFTFTGLDAGDYKLEETDVPSGYHKANNIEFSIDAVYENGALKSLSSSSNQIEIEKNNGNLTGNLNVTVVNQSGSLLPSTGGFGTTLFTVFGGVLMTFSVILLISKKRMAGRN